MVDCKALLGTYTGKHMRLHFKWADFTFVHSVAMTYVRSIINHHWVEFDRGAHPITILNIVAAYSVTVGLQQTAYTITEVDGYQLVCLEVLSGNVEGRELVFDYTTSSGTASI